MEVNHPIEVREATKRSMAVIEYSVAVVGENVVGADGSAEMIERVKPMQHEQQVARWFL